jgi:arginyl-tRNA synthetase
MTHLEELRRQRLAEGFAAVAGKSVDPVLRRSQRADFQANGALALGRILGRDPRQIADEVLRNTRLEDLCAAAEVAGPGYINLVVDNRLLGRLLAAMAPDARLGVPITDSPEIVVVDYSAPNTAKEMHVGHLRSTIIGDAAVRLLEWLGHTIVRENHVGDWGTPFGMLIEHLLDIGEAEASHELSVGDLDGFYKAARRKFDDDPGFQERARRRVVLLQRGDAETRRLWERLSEESMQYFMTVYDRLGVRLTKLDFVGESSYNDQLESVVDELDRLGLLRDSEGAEGVFPKGFTNRDGEPLPLIVRKRDGGFGYAATDLATIRHRVRDLGATRLLYVVGLPQQQHLAMLFEVAREADWLTPPVRAEHVGFGSVLGTDGKPLRSRAGRAIKLIDLLDEAVARAAAAVAERNPSLDEQTRSEVAQAVGIGAVKYADISTDRTKDYVFDYDRMLAFDGKTGPYLQYAHTRIRSIFRRAGIDAPGVAGAVTVSEPAERALALELLQFSTVLEGVAESLEFHRLANYLYELSTIFTAFYESCPVLRAEGEVRQSRLVLCDLTARVLALGLGLLGITAPDLM